MTHKLYSTQKDIEAWLKKQGVERYSLVADKTYGFVVNSETSVYLNDRPLKEIKVKFNEVRGFFDCSNSGLTSLLGCPYVVGKDMDCSMNELESLEHCTERIKFSFFCQDNNLADIIHFPQEVLRMVYLQENPRLGELQNINDYDTLFTIHLKSRIAYLEKEILEHRLKLIRPLEDEPSDKGAFKV